MLLLTHLKAMGNHIECVQRKATKFILNDYSSDHKSTLESLHILLLKLWFDLQDIMFLIKCLQNHSHTINISRYVKFVSSNTRAHTSNKLKHKFKEHPKQGIFISITSSEFRTQSQITTLIYLCQRQTLSFASEPSSGVVFSQISTQTTFLHFTFCALVPNVTNLNSQHNNVLILSCVMLTLSWVLLSFFLIHLAILLIVY